MIVAYMTPVKGFLIIALKTTRHQEVPRFFSPSVPFHAGHTKLKLY